LYRLAARHAEAIIAQDALTVAARIDLTIELARTLSQWGLASPPGSREELWRRAHDCLASAIASQPSHPRRMLLELQDALLWLGEGELAQEESLMTANEEAMETAREKLRSAIAMLVELADRVEEALRKERMARTGNSHTEGLSREELSSLAQHIVLQTALALEAQAETYPPNSPDRTNALTRAIDQLRFLQSRAGDSELRQQAEVSMIACHRLLGNLDEAQRLLAVTSKDAAFSSGKIAAEKVRLLLAAGRTDDALSIANQQYHELGTNSPELMLAHLEALVSDCLGSKLPSPPSEATRQATQILAALTDRHGSRWQRRGELWVARLFAATNQTANTAATARLAAEGLFRAGRPDAAVAAFDRAAGLAREEADAQAAFDLALTAAAVVRHAGDQQEAAHRYLTLALGDPSNPRAAEAHRLGILATAEAVRMASPANRTEALRSYEELLASHLAQWPAGASSDEVRIWLAKWRLQAEAPGVDGDDLQQVLDLLQAVTRQSEHYAASRRMMGEAFQERLEQLDDATEQAALANEAAHALQPVITGEGNQWPTEWTDLERDVALVLARMQLVHVQDGATYADALLAAALANVSHGSDEWRQRAIGIHLAAKAVLGQSERAEALLVELADAPASVKADVVLCMGETLKSASEAVRERVSRIVLQLLEGIEHADPPLEDEVRLRLAHIGARALVAAGRLGEAMAAYNDLIALVPEDAEVHEEYASLLAASDSIDDQRRALRLYQEIEQRSKPGGHRWMRARLARVALFSRLGEADQARKLLRLTTTMHPELEATGLRQQFEALARELGE
jgi:tetratricopeptide (TPR) repeat protein